MLLKPLNLTKQEIVNELFKNSFVGDDLQNGLLGLVNGIKKSYYVPPILQLSNITTIPKKNKMMSEEDLPKRH